MFAGFGYGPAMAGNEIERASDLIEGRFEVIQPPPSVSWSFWRDDVPAVLQMVSAPALAGLIGYVIHHALR